MESVNKTLGEIDNFLPGSLFRSSVARIAIQSGRTFASVRAALLAVLAIAVAILVGHLAPARADLENQVFTSKPDKLRLVVPRGWVATEQPSYPGLLLSMMREEPAGRMALTAEAFTRDLYCSWPATCRTSKESLASKFACALRSKLGADKTVHIGPVQAGPKENDAAGLPSVWFEYDDGKHFVRQAVALASERAISLLLVAASTEARGSHARAFEQALRTVSILVETVPEPDAGVPIDALPDDALTLMADAAMLDAGARFESAPAPRINPVGSCPEAR